MVFVVKERIFQLFLSVSVDGILSQGFQYIFSLHFPLPLGVEKCILESISELMDGHLKCVDLHSFLLMVLVLKNQRFFVRLRFRKFIDVYFGIIRIIEELIL